MHAGRRNPVTLETMILQMAAGAEGRKPVWTGKGARIVVVNKLEHLPAATEGFPIICAFTCACSTTASRVISVVERRGELNSSVGLRPTIWQIERRREIGLNMTVGARERSIALFATADNGALRSLLSYMLHAHARGHCTRHWIFVERTGIIRRYFFGK